MSILKKTIFGMVILSLIIYFSGEFKPARYYSLLCTDSTATKGGLWNYEYDSYFIGSNGCLYDPDSVPIDKVPPVFISSDNTNQKTPLWYINGANHRADWVLPEMHLLAQNSGRPVVAIYNATLGGRFPDAISDSLNENKIAKVLATQILHNLSINKEIYISCNSQGAMHVSHGLQQTVEELNKSYSPLEINKLLNKIHVETAGGAGKIFPDGPQYIHYINSNDPVPYHAGVLSNGAHKGKNALIVEFSDHDSDPIEPKYRFVGPLTTKFINVHGFNMYIQYRQAFDKLYQRKHAKSLP